MRHSPCYLCCVDFARQDPGKLVKDKVGRKGRDGKGRANEPQKLQRGAAKFQRCQGIWGTGPPGVFTGRGFWDTWRGGGSPGFSTGTRVLGCEPRLPAGFMGRGENFVSCA